MKMVLLQPKGKAWRATVFSEDDTHKDYIGAEGKSADQVMKAWRARYPHALILVADITDLDIENAANGIFLEPVLI
jgi:hypothetical protein